MMIGSTYVVQPFGKSIYQSYTTQVTFGVKRRNDKELNEMHFTEIQGWTLVIEKNDYKIALYLNLASLKKYLYIYTHQKDLRGRTVAILVGRRMCISCALCAFIF